MLAGVLGEAELPSQRTEQQLRGAGLTYTQGKVAYHIILDRPVLAQEGGTSIASGLLHNSPHRLLGAKMMSMCVLVLIEELRTDRENRHFCLIAQASVTVAIDPCVVPVAVH